MNEHANKWWGGFDVPIGENRRWQIGPLTLWMERLPGEWRLTTRLGEDLLAADLEICASSSRPEPLATDSVQRFGVSGDSGLLTLVPCLADRHVISRPEEPFILPPGQTSVIFVGTPLWLRLQVGERNTVLKEFPLVQPSDTWFGPSTREGDLCYASRTRCRLSLDGMHRPPHRATTLVRLVNRADTPLGLERLNLPVVHLDLHERADDHLWTDDVRFERTGSGDLVELKLSDRWRRPPERSELITAARQPVGPNLMFRAFTSLFDSVTS